MDYGVHPPNVSLPWTIPEPLLIEPAETESRESLDAYIAAMIAVAEESVRMLEVVRSSPHSQRVARVRMPEETSLATGLGHPA